MREQRKLDPLIDAALASGWPLKRVEALLRAVLRAGAFELDQRRDIPVRVIVSEYVDVANAFVDRDETGMVNAVLDALARQLRAGRAASSAENAGRAAMESAEDKLIAQFFRPLATHPGALGLTDDAAFFSPPEGHEVVLKTDAMVEGVHFLPDDPPDAVARKALRVNLSDLAAKGAKPAGFLLSLALPKARTKKWLEGFARGLRADASTTNARCSAAIPTVRPGR